MGGAAAHLLVVVRVADDDGLDGGRVGEGVVSTRAGWARFSLLEALGQLENRLAGPPPCQYGIGTVTLKQMQLRHCRDARG